MKIYLNDIMKKRTEEIGKIQIGFYGNVSQQACDQVITLDCFLRTCQSSSKNLVEILRSIKDEDEQKKFKTNYLYCGMLNCLCGQTKEDIESVNDIIVLDIDLGDNLKLDNESKLLEYRQLIFNLPYVYAVSLSCRGKGFYVVILTDNQGSNIEESKAKFLGHFYALEKDLYDNYGLTVDSQCKNINRLRFISYDDNILVKENKEIEYYDKVLSEEESVNYKAPVIVEKEKVENRFVSGNDDIDDDKFIYNLVSALIKNGYSADNYGSWFRDGSRLAAFGEFGKLLFYDLSRNSAGFTNDGAVEKQFNACSNWNNRPDREKAAKYYFWKAKEILGSDWKYKIKNNLI